MPEIIIIGGGIIGLLTAKQLVDAGHSVMLFDKGAFGRAASWAGGGIVSPLYPWRYPLSVTVLSKLSQALYPELSCALWESTGINSEYVRSGILMAEVIDQADALRWAAANQQIMHVLDGPEIAHIAPGLGPQFERALFLPHAAQLRNPKLIRAVIAYLEQQPLATLNPYCRVSRCVVQGNKVIALETAQGKFSADHFVLCAGAWSPELLAPLHISLSVKPVKGQMLCFKTDKRLLSQMVLCGKEYLVPRLDGMLLVGSTLENQGFDTLPTEKAYRQLYQAALKILPALQNQPLFAQWAGLRPGSPNGVPTIGPVSPFVNFWINTGHFRNGLLLAPSAAQLLADLILGRPPICDPRCYTLPSYPRQSLAFSGDNAVLEN